jgi:hypothetical protein
VRIVVNGTASEIARLLGKFDDNEPLAVGIEINGHKSASVLAPAEVVHMRKPMSLSARRAISRAQKARWRKSR